MTTWKASEAEKRPSRIQLGAMGEALAVDHLAGMGLRILHRNWRCRHGELDVIACDDARRTVVFVEVKTRATAAELDFAIDERRLARVAAAAEILAPRYATGGEDVRVDVVLIAPGTRPRHIENAWIG